MRISEYEDVMRKAWPWTQAFMRQLLQMRTEPFNGTHLMLGSDYSGDHRKSRFKVYGFVLANADTSPSWPSRVDLVRREFLKDGRRMSFKNMNDGHRRRALVPFLEATEALDGHVVVVAVTKELTWLTSSPTSRTQSEVSQTLKARWDHVACEEMVRVAHFFAMLLGAWSSPGMHVSWFTDDDMIVANENRLDDMHLWAAKISSFYTKHPLGEFMFNKVSVFPENRSYEDFLAIPDLAAGMFAEVLANRTKDSELPNSRIRIDAELSEKSDVISSWFAHSLGTLKKTCILIDKKSDGRFGIGELQLGEPH